MREPAVPAPPHTSPPPPDRVRPRQTPFPESLQLRSHLGSQWKRRFLTEAAHARETARFVLSFSRVEYIPRAPAVTEFGPNQDHSSNLRKSPVFPRAPCGERFSPEQPRACGDRMSYIKFRLRSS